MSADAKGYPWLPTIEGESQVAFWIRKRNQIKTLCTLCKRRPRCSLASDDVDLITGTSRLHAQIRKAAELPRSAVVVLKDWENVLRKEIRKGHYCHNCLQAWAAHMPREEYRGDDD